MQNIFKPVWSRQHGAYITLITSWLTGTLISGQVYLIHFVILIMLMAGFNFTEFMQDKFKNIKITTIGFIETGFQILSLVYLLIALK